MTEADDRRTGDRMVAAGRVMIVRGDDARFVELLDASEGGCALRRIDAMTLEVENVVRLFFYPDDGGAPLVVPARVARIDADGIGIEYHEAQPVPPMPLPSAPVHLAR